jgi:nucleoside-diphosphate-sugar epimerase
MARRTALVTGSSGLIGSELTAYLDRDGWTVHGVDNNLRREFFGEHGDTAPTSSGCAARRGDSSTTTSTFATGRRCSSSPTASAPH